MIFITILLTEFFMNQSPLFRYIMIAAMIGVYSVPLLRRIRPQLHKTSMTRVIANCTTILVLSSALPVLARTLGLFHRFINSLFMSS